MDFVENHFSTILIRQLIFNKFYNVLFDNMRININILDRNDLHKPTILIDECSRENKVNRIVELPITEMTPDVTFFAEFKNLFHKNLLSIPYKIRHPEAKGT